MFNTTIIIILFIFVDSIQKKNLIVLIDVNKIYLYNVNAMLLLQKNNTNRVVKNFHKI